MNKLFLFLLMSFAILSVNAQEKENEVKEENRLSAYAEVTAYD